MPFGAAPANVGRSACITRVHRYLPLSRHAPRALKRLARRLLPAADGGRRAALSKTDAKFIEATYAVSNLRTEGLLTRLGRDSGNLEAEERDMRCAR